MKIRKPLSTSWWLLAAACMVAPGAIADRRRTGLVAGHRAGTGQGQRRHHHQDRARGASDQRPPRTQGRSRSPEERRAVEEGDCRSHAATAGQRHRRAARHPAWPREGAASERRAVQPLADVDAEGPGPRGRQEVRGGAEAGGHGDQRHSPERREAVPALAGADRRVRRQAADHRGRSAAVLPGQPEGIRRAGNGHASARS